MTYPRFHMTHEEQTDTSSRAISVLTSGQGAEVSLALGDTFIDLSLADLAFIGRCVNALPAELLSVGIEAEQHERVGEAEPEEVEKPARHGKRWTEEEDRQVLEALQEGATPKDIAAMVGRSPASIVSRLLAFGAADVRPNPGKVAQLLSGEGSG